MDRCPKGRRGRSLAPLDWLNFFLADVRDGLGPYLAIFLLAVRHWDAASIGVVMTIMGVATLAAQTPVGAFIDRTRWKRGAIVVASALVGLSAVAITLIPGFIAVAASKAVMGVMAAVFAPAVAAITRGLVAPRDFAARIGRNEAFNHAGNAVTAILAGLVGAFVSTAAIFWLVAAMAVASIVATLAIDGSAIDHEAARGLAPGDAAEQPSHLAVLLECQPLLVFAISIGLFHLANAAMLPLIGQELALDHDGQGALFMSACIVVAQIVMTPMALLVGRRADRWGRKALFLAAFLVLPVRGVLFTLSHDSTYLIAVQILDGVGAGLFGALFPIVIADLTAGTGRYNLALGAAATVQGLGAALSTTLAGFIVVHAGYNAAFLALATIAALAALLFLTAMPETMPVEIANQPMPRRAKAVQGRAG